METAAILCMTVVFVTYGFAGGLRATIVTEGIQGPLIVLMSILLVPFGLYKIGGFSGLHQALPEKMFDLWAQHEEFAPKWVITMTLIALIGWVAQPGIVAAVGSGKTELEGRIGYTYGTMIKRVCALAWVFTGLIVVALAAQGKLSEQQVKDLADPKNRELAFGTAIRSSLPVGLLGLTFAAIFASQMATLSAQMVNSSALATRNLYKALFRPGAGDREVLIVGRIIGIFLVAIGVLLAMSLDSVAKALTMLLQFSAIMGVVVWGGVLWRRANSFGAWASVIVLFVIWAAFGQVGQLLAKHLDAPPAWLGAYADPKHAFDLSIRYLPAGVAALVLVSLLTPAIDREKVRHFFLLLKTPVGQEQKLIDAGVPIVYAGSTTANYWETNHPKLVHWGGFLLACVVSAAMLGMLLLLARIGA
jgi:Na+/proline symporter